MDDIIVLGENKTEINNIINKITRDIQLDF